MHIVEYLFWDSKSFFVGEVGLHVAWAALGDKVEGAEGPGLGLAALCGGRENGHIEAVLIEVNLVSGGLLARGWQKRFGGLGIAQIFISHFSA